MGGEKVKMRIHFWTDLSRWISQNAYNFSASGPDLDSKHYELPSSSKNVSKGVKWHKHIYHFSP